MLKALLILTFQRHLSKWFVVKAYTIFNQSMSEMIGDKDTEEGETELYEGYGEVFYRASIVATCRKQKL